MMSASQRQRKIAAKTVRRKAVVVEKKKLEPQSGSLAARVGLASKGAFVQCLVPSNLFEIGIGQVVVARALPSGLLGCAYFLLDVFCLGVKDVFYTEIGKTELRSRLAAQEDIQQFVEVEPAYARKLIRGAATYAADLGLPAAKDTQVIEAIFGDISVETCAEIFLFGKDGRPFFVSGPNDTPERIRNIARALERRRGSA
jgi:hypothetical protein